jgi:gliding motility-associated-like protein
MSKRNVFLLLFFCLFSMKNFATHIVGGEIYYDYLGGNNYLITLKVYRDCATSTTPFDTPASVFIFNSSGSLFDSILLQNPVITRLPAVINNPCFTPPTNICVEQAIYKRTVHLPPVPGGYDLSYQRCCRNNTIINIVNPGDVGSTYMAHIPDPSFALNNNSPRYNSFPPIFICSGVPLVFNHSATDPDGDSLYYEFCDPFAGASSDCPIYGPQAPFPACEVMGPPPPFETVPWASGYSSTYQMSSSPAMSIDHNTGMLTGTPNLIGQWVVGVCVSEYRNGVFLDINKRDFQFNVVNCPGLPVAAFPVQNSFCFGYTAHFTQNSISANTYFWNFGDTTTTADTSHLASDTWTYPGPGNYTVTLIINKGTICADTASTTFVIQPRLKPYFSPQPGQCVNKNSFDFAAGGDFQGNGTFSWNFGDHATPPTATGINCSHIVFDSAGIYPVTLTITENGCTKTHTKAIEIYPKPVADYHLASDISCELQPVHFIGNSTNDTALTFEWNFGDGEVSTKSNPFHTYQSVGSYTTSVMVTSAHGCKDTFALPAAVQVYPSPQAGLKITPSDTSIFYPDISAQDQSSGAISCFVDWGDGTVNDCNSKHSYSKPGTYKVMQVVENASGCYDTAYSDVLIRPEFVFWMPNAFTPNGNDINDIFKPKLIGVHDYNFLIFDRWGEKIFETHNSEDGWNGFFKGKLCSNDVYVYKIFFRDDVKNDFHQYIGRVTLVR